MAARKTQTVRESVDNGSRRDVLLASARVLADRLDNPDTPPAYVPGLAARLKEAMDAVQALDLHAEQARLAGWAKGDQPFDPSIV